MQQIHLEATQKKEGMFLRMRKINFFAWEFLYKLKAKKQEIVFYLPIIVVFTFVVEFVGL